MKEFGFTGTQLGMTKEQKRAFVGLIQELFADEDEIHFHFGDCIGADKEAFEIVTEMFPFGIKTIAHPGLGPSETDNKKRAYCSADEVREPMENLARNIIIVANAADGLIATPRTASEVIRSGTWHTLRAARNINEKKGLDRPIKVIRPNGIIEDFVPEITREKSHGVMWADKTTQMFLAPVVEEDPFADEPAEPVSSQALKQDFVQETVRNSHALLAQHQKNFQKTFGRSLGQYMHPLFGFDLVKFDDWFRPTEGHSLAEEIQFRYGKEARQLVETLIGAPKEEKGQDYDDIFADEEEDPFAD